MEKIQGVYERIPPKSSKSKHFLNETKGNVHSMNKMIGVLLSTIHGVSIKKSPLCLRL